jgi:predicted kinase
MPELRNQTVVLVTGAPGVGKSTVASGVAHALGAISLDIDAIFEPVVPLLAAHPRAVARTAIYESLIATAEASLAAGCHVLVAAPFTRERRDPLAWDQVSARLSSRGAAAVLVWLHAPRAVLLERLANRGAARDAHKLADPASWLADAEPSDPPVVSHIAVDATQATEGAVRQVLRELMLRERRASSCADGRPSSSGQACSFSV